ncbi:PREDICTED: alpha-2B adrenergic receptor-like [Chaetura pelagica]|uniref:alpha-2B adrenergic receptor-like n=1 Tax=Chaetura pelagica TaxID=8897 RepID=UPI0005235067|nr:PREDICTED: alpha-2B adrenergic receptor-like [Chaetura pelagica]
MFPKWVKDPNNWIYLALDVLFCTSSIVHLCAISLDRYWSVSAVGYNAKRTPRRIKCGIVTVWAIAAAISLPPLLYKGGEKKEEEVGTRLQCKLNEEAWYVLSSSIGSFFAPCLIMVLVYLRIYFIARRRHRSRPAGTRPPGDTSPNVTKPPEATSPNVTKPPGDMSPNVTSREPPRTCLPVDRTSLLSPEEPPGSPSPMVGTCPQAGECTGGHRRDIRGHPRDNGNHSRDTEGHPRDTLATKLGRAVLTHELNPRRRKTQVKREQRFTLVLAVVIGVFILCWFPFFFLYSLGALCPHHCKVPDSVFQVFFWIGYCNSSLNPIIYTIFNRDFRRAFRHLLCPRAPAPC